MGCNIHARVELWNGEEWVPSDCVFIDTDDDTPSCDPFDHVGKAYSLFAMLADVRQERGVPIPVIHSLRGLPEDVSPKIFKALGGFLCEGTHQHSEMCYRQFDTGLHSHSWATGAELVAYDMSRPYISQWGDTLDDVIGGHVDTFRQIAALADDPSDVRVVYGFDS